ncbi:hypothetical protein J6590_019751 [Homalodisca vitripennis]|nr:hypothetical protein J6590_019751 [Homalodisca vitripennis]
MLVRNVRTRPYFLERNHSLPDDTVMLVRNIRTRPYFLERNHSLPDDTVMLVRNVRTRPYFLERNHSLPDDTVMLVRNVRTRPYFLERNHSLPDDTVIYCAVYEVEWRQSINQSVLRPQSTISREAAAAGTYRSTIRSPRLTARTSRAPIFALVPQHTTTPPSESFFPQNRIANICS